MKTITKNLILIIALLALVSMMIMPVSAETLTGTLGGPGQNTYLNVATNSSYAQNPDNDYTHFSIKGAQTTAGLKTIIHFDAIFPPYFTCPDTSGTVLFNVTHDGIKMGEGTFGFQRFWAGWPIATEQLGYQYYEFSSWNTSGQTGGIGSKINYQGYAEGVTPCGMAPHAIQYTQSVAKIQGWETQPTLIVFGASPTTGGESLYTNYGSYTNVFDTPFENRYTVTKPLGLGIKGYVNKTIGGTTYNSQIFIENATSGVSIASDTTIIGTDFSFNVPLDNIRIKALTQNGWFNSSVLFAPTPTPTPTSTPTPTTTIPAGYVRNNLYVWDQNDAQIAGADVDVRDVENASWTNTTADADGWITIDTLPYHTVNVYAHYPTAGIYLSNEILGLETGYYGGHNWVLVLYPYVTTPSGFVTLYINTRNYDTKAVLTGVNLQIKNLVTGAITGESTGSTDSVSTVVTNATNYQITGSKSGYLSKTININSGEASSKTVVVELSKATVTPVPTATTGPGGTTPVYVDPNDPSLHRGDTSLKAQEMMNWIAMNGMTLVQLCFLVTVLALFGVKLGK